MKSMIELPTKGDFLETDILRLLQPQNAHFSIAQYRKGKVNMRAVIDFVEFNEKLILFDESRNEEYTNAMQAWQLAQQQAQSNAHQTGWTVSQPNPQPAPPTKEVQLQGTRVIYHNGQERIIMKPVEDWEDRYFAYLTEQRLDIIK